MGSDCKKMLLNLIRDGLWYLSWKDLSDNFIMLILGNLLARLFTQDLTNRRGHWNPVLLKYSLCVFNT